MLPKNYSLLHEAFTSPIFLFDSTAEITFISCSPMPIFAIGLGSAASYLWAIYEEYHARH